ncbi:MAG: hypothetical protein KGY66_00960 [Candidatus Thermoplasmatota archaeon]|nr:hypothetical protein [Candidatus Thermoplasmatota archaeon]MBS3789470.1 hypothetical protein [Candidatus Thermoplasmatota archaeon]
MRLRKEKYRDPSTRKLQEEGLLKFKEEKERGNTVRKIKEFGKITYDFWSGVKYIVVLSAILWWIPLFGPMLAGYVGGRRTGGPKKGILASFLGLGIIGAIYYLLSQGYLYFALAWALEYPDKIISIASSHSFFGPYLEFVHQYWTIFFDRVLAGVPFGSNSYILTIVFAYIGGIISYEKRKESTDGVRSLGRVKDELASLHRYAKNPMDRQNYNAVDRKSLSDLRSVRYNGKRKDQCEFAEAKGQNKRSMRDNSGEGESEERMKLVRQNDGKNIFESERPLPRSNVRHHSKSNGDDWEFL